jgi:hypothetical protein
LSASAATAQTAVISQGSIYNIPPPPSNKPGKAALKTIAETIQGVGNMVAGVGVAGLVANGLASLGVVTLPATVPGAGVSAIVAGVGLGISFIGGFMKNYLSDPIDFKFTSIARPASVHLPKLEAPAPLLRGVTGDERKLLLNVLRGLALSQAFVTSVDRAHGALIRNDAFWEQRQLDAAVGYAHEGAKLLALLPAVQAAIRDGFERAGVTIVISPENIARNQRKLASGLPGPFATVLKTLGLTRDKGQIEQTLRSAKAPRYGLEFPAVLTDHSLLGEERRAERTLAGYNRSSILAIIHGSPQHG